MKYKLGQKVVIRRNLGEENGRNQGDYYWGGNVGKMPLGSEGVVEKVSDDHYVLSIGKKRRFWQVHPDELERRNNQQIFDPDDITDLLLEEEDEGKDFVGIPLQDNFDLAGDDVDDDLLEPLEDLAFGILDDLGGEDDMVGGIEDLLLRDPAEVAGLERLRGGFRKNQEVIVRKNLGEKNGRDADNYFYGGDVEEVPLNTKARIEGDTEVGGVRIVFDDPKYGVNGSWAVHPDEIELVGQEENKLEIGLEQGQRVTLMRALGREGGYGKEQYYHGHETYDFPVGTQGRICDECDITPERICVTVRGHRQMYVHPKELYTAKELLVRRRLEHDKRRAAMEKLLGVEDPEDRLAKEREAALERRKAAAQPVIADLLVAEEPVDVIDEMWQGMLDEEAPAEEEKDEHAFNPSFNVREEFAVWVRKEFPKIDEYQLNHEDMYEEELYGRYIYPPEQRRRMRNRKGKVYEELDARMKEVHEAAKLACAHGTKTTQECVAAQFQKLGNLVKTNYRNPEKYAGTISSLVNWIETVSGNLGKQKHYGTRVVKGRKNTGREENEDEY